jgi:hypothetical protein
VGRAGEQSVGDAELGTRLSQAAVVVEAKYGCIVYTPHHHGLGDEPPDTPSTTH